MHSTTSLVQSTIIPSGLLLFAGKSLKPTVPHRQRHGPVEPRPSQSLQNDGYLFNTCSSRRRRNIARFGITGRRLDQHSHPFHFAFHHRDVHSAITRWIRPDFGCSLCCFGSWRSHASKNLILGETDHFILGVIRNLCALSATVSYARCNNNRDHSPHRRHGFTPKVATTPAKTGHNKAAVRTSAISRIEKPSL